LSLIKGPSLIITEEIEFCYSFLEKFYHTTFVNAKKTAGILPVGEVYAKIGGKEVIL